MASERVKDTPESSPRQEHKYTAKPGNVVLLHDLTEIREIWGASAERVYRAVAQGRLRAYGRPGRQKYYSESELIALFGEPGGIGPQPAKLPAKGPYQQPFEFTRAAAA